MALVAAQDRGRSGTGSSPGGRDGDQACGQDRWLDHLPSEPSVARSLLLALASGVLGTPRNTRAEPASRWDEAPYTAQPVITTYNIV
ncbi:hypothetical protein GCM10010317_102440 [Streptomyces mirabilis]|nr:hypothetical protein GCM10010317_102440 [Streptomyces mirabilis]